MTVISQFLQGLPPDERRLVGAFLLAFVVLGLISLNVVLYLWMWPDFIKARMAYIDWRDKRQAGKEPR